MPTDTTAEPTEITTAIPAFGPEAYIPGHPQWYQRLGIVGKWYQHTVTDPADGAVYDLREWSAEQLTALKAAGGKAAEVADLYLRGIGTGVQQWATRTATATLVVGGLTVVAVVVGGLLVWRLTK